MTPKEALTIFKLGHIRKDVAQTDAFIEACKVVENTIEKATPMKVIYDDVGRSYCPTCHCSYTKNVMGNENKYCGNCQQKLDWSDEK